MNDIRKAIEEAFASGMLQRESTETIKKPPEETTRSIIVLAKQEKTQKEISYEVGRHHTSVCATLRKYGTIVWLDHHELDAIREYRNSQNK